MMLVIALIATTLQNTSKHLHLMQATQVQYRLQVKCTAGSQTR